MIECERARVCVRLWRMNQSIRRRSSEMNRWMTCVHKLLQCIPLRQLAEQNAHYSISWYISVGLQSIARLRSMPFTFDLEFSACLRQPMHRKKNQTAFFSHKPFKGICAWAGAHTRWHQFHKNVGVRRSTVICGGEWLKIGTNTRCSCYSRTLFVSHTLAFAYQLKSGVRSLIGISAFSSNNNNTNKMATKCSIMSPTK